MIFPKKKRKKNNSTLNLLGDSEEENTLSEFACFPIRLNALFIHPKLRKTIFLPILCHFPKKKKKTFGVLDAEDHLKTLKIVQISVANLVQLENFIIGLFQNYSVLSNSH